MKKAKELENILDQIDLEERKTNVKWTYSNKIGIWMAIISFAIGTFLLLSYLLTKENDLPIIGLFFVMFASFINGLMFSGHLILLFTQKQQLHSNLKTMGILILNIPIAIGYFYIFTLIERF